MVKIVSLGLMSLKTSTLFPFLISFIFFGVFLPMHNFWSSWAIRESLLVWTLLDFVAGGWGGVGWGLFRGGCNFLFLESSSLLAFCNKM